MRKFMIMLAAACLLTVPVMAAQTYTYDWADGDADYLGCFDNDTGCLVSTLCNRTGSAGSGLALEKQTYLYADGVAKGFLATIWNLVEGDEVTVSVWRYDSNANMPYFRLWAHYNDHLEEAADARGQDMLANDGDMQGNNDFGNQSGWEQFSHTWTVEAGHTGMVIDAAVFGDYLATVYIDDLEVTVPDHASVRLPNAIYAAGGEVTPVQMETWTSVKNLFD